MHGFRNPVKPRPTIGPMFRLELRGLTRRHRGAVRAAVDGFNLGVHAGEFVSLLGPSGCGKSTVLRIIAGLETPDAGQVSIDGVDLGAQLPSARPVSVVFQNYALFPHLSALDNVAFGPRAAGRPAAAAREAARAALALVEMDGLRDRAPAELSGGQQQRVALARALVLEPSVLLFDEPLANLDEGLRRQVREQIRALQRRLGLTALYVTHDHADAMAVSDRVVVMNEGRIAQIGTPRELYEQPVSTFVAGFMGEGRVFDALAGADGVLRIGALELPTPQTGLAGQVRVMVRPQAWRIERARAQGLPARVLRCAYLGRCVEYTLASELGEVFAISARSQSRHEPGAPVSLSLAPGAGVVILP